MGFDVDVDVDVDGGPGAGVVPGVGATKHDTPLWSWYTRMVTPSPVVRMNTRAADPIPSDDVPELPDVSGHRAMGPADDGDDSPGARAAAEPLVVVGVRGPVESAATELGEAAASPR
jgi:hypothetical protein